MENNIVYDFRIRSLQLIDLHTINCVEIIHNLDVKSIYKKFLCDDGFLPLQ